MSNLDEEKTITSNQELILKCLELILEKSELSDQKLGSSAFLMGKFMQSLRNL